MSEDLSSLLLSVAPESLLDIEKAIATIRSISFEKANSVCEVYRNCEMKFDDWEQLCSGVIRKEEKEFKDISTEMEHMEQKLLTLVKEKVELEEKIKRNKHLCEESVPIDTDDNELSDLMKRVCTLKGELETKKRNIRHDINQFKMGIQYYNKYLQCNVMVEEGNIVIFTPNVSAKSASDVKDYIKFITSDDATTFQYLEMQPKLENELSLVERFQETEDIQGLILSFLKALRLFKGEKVK